MQRLQLNTRRAIYITFSSSILPSVNFDSNIARRAVASASPAHVDCSGVVHRINCVLFHSSCIRDLRCLPRLRARNKARSSRAAARGIAWCNISVGHHRSGALPRAVQSAREALRIWHASLSPEHENIADAEKLVLQLQQDLN